MKQPHDVYKSQLKSGSYYNACVVFMQHFLAEKNLGTIFKVAKTLSSQAVLLTVFESFEWQDFGISS